jgi:hypothetical protein
MAIFAGALALSIKLIKQATDNKRRYGAHALLLLAKIVAQQRIMKNRRENENRNESISESETSRRGAA